ncbi:hypothetical protein WIW50_09830 [Flavobacteriaceae bacterium 3-367]|uniref:hypothetical protein n=1 Tax=Eudoraea algarum TaxID=3417568 RepID=UPI003272529E
MQITLFLIILSSFVISPSQETNQIGQIEGVYLGRVEGGYSFCCKTGPEVEGILVFNEVLSVILKKHPLHFDKHIGENFIISFTKDVMVWHDGSKEISTIIRLQKLMPGQHL